MTFITCRECQGPHVSRCCPIRGARYSEGTERDGIEREMSDNFEVIEEFNERYISGLKIGEEEKVKGKDRICFKKRVIVVSFSVIKGVEAEPTRICELTNGKLAADVNSELFRVFCTKQRREENFDSMWKSAIDHPHWTADQLPFDDTWDPDDCRQFAEEFASLFQCS